MRRPLSCLRLAVVAAAAWPPQRRLQSSSGGVTPFHHHHPGVASPLSVDMHWRELRDKFYDPKARRCLLCDEYIGSLAWTTHNSFAPHSAREGVAQEMLQAYVGTPLEFCDSWWEVMDSHPNFTSERFGGRVKALSGPIGAVDDLAHRPAARQLRHGHVSVHRRFWQRRERLWAVFGFLKRHRVLQDSLDVIDTSSGSTGRTWEFERLEWVGDNVIKPLFNDRVAALFPASSGGVRGKNSYMTSMIDSNDGLARAYEFFELWRLTGSDQIVSKFKSDVVESIYGELQAFVWATEAEWGVEAFQTPFDVELTELRAVAKHCLDEFATMMFMLHVEGVRAAVEAVLQKENVPLVRSDKTLRGLTPTQRAAELLRRSAFTLRPSAAPVSRVGAAAADGLAAAATAPGQNLRRARTGASSGVPLTRAAANKVHSRVVPLAGLGPEPTPRVGPSSPTVPMRLLHGYAVWLATAATTTTSPGGIAWPRLSQGSRCGRRAAARQMLPRVSEVSVDSDATKSYPPPPTRTAPPASNAAASAAVAAASMLLGLTHADFAARWAAAPMPTAFAPLGGASLAAPRLLATPGRLRVPWMEAPAEVPELGLAATANGVIGSSDEASIAATEALVDAMLDAASNSQTTGADGTTSFSAKAGRMAAAAAAAAAAGVETGGADVLAAVCNPLVSGTPGLCAGYQHVAGKPRSLDEDEALAAKTVRVTARLSQQHAPLTTTTNPPSARHRRLARVPTPRTSGGGDTAHERVSSGAAEAAARANFQSGVIVV